MIDLLKISPGYKCIQHIYMFYLLKYGFVVGLLAALIYPLPYSILFLMITVDLDVPFVAIFMLAGMRSGAIALLLKYCFHFPKHTFHWIVLLFTIAIGIILPNSNFTLTKTTFLFCCLPSVYSYRCTLIAQIQDNQHHHNNSFQEKNL